jgi:excinuclease ABC subunit C
MIPDERLGKILDDIPAEPGVYFMKEDDGRVLYVGKAVDLNSRVRSYFHDSSEHSPKIRNMIEMVDDVDYLTTESEVEALLKEARLIKDVQPPYNSRLKDDKSRILIQIRSNEDFPRVELVRETDDLKPDEYDYFGPFLSAGDVRGALNVLQKLFKYRTCDLDIEAGDPQNQYFRPCLLYEIEQCTAPCADHITKDEYREDIDAFKEFLEGNREELIEELEHRMWDASEDMEYERAAKIRDQIEQIRGLEKKGTLEDVGSLQVPPSDPSDALDALREVLNLDFHPRTVDATDIASLSGKEAAGAVVTFVDGKPFKDGYRRYRIKTVEGVDDYDMIREVIRRRYTRLEDEEQPFPHIHLIDGGRGHLNAVVDEFEQIGIEPPVLVSIAKTEGDQLFLPDREEPIRPEENNRGFQILQHARDEAHRFAGHYHRILRDQKNDTDQ